MKTAETEPDGAQHLTGINTVSINVEDLDHGLVAVGQTIVSDWVVVDQKMITDFGHTTLDPDLMHIDADFAAKGPFKKPLAFGFLTLSLLTHLFQSASKTTGAKTPDEGILLNYGFDRVRLVSPILVDSRVRGRFTPISRTIDGKHRIRTTLDCAIEIEGGDRPALVATWLSMFVPPAEDA